MGELSSFTISGIEVSEVRLASLEHTRNVISDLLAEEGIFFAVTPLPDGEYAIAVKPEWGPTLLEIMDEASAG